MNSILIQSATHQITTTSNYIKPYVSDSRMRVDWRNLSVLYILMCGRFPEPDQLNHGYIIYQKPSDLINVFSFFIWSSVAYR